MVYPPFSFSQYSPATDMYSPLPLCRHPDKNQEPGAEARFIEVLRLPPLQRRVP